MKYVSLLLVLAVVCVTGCGAITTKIDFSPQNLSSMSAVTKKKGFTKIVKVGDIFEVGDFLIENTTKTKFVVLPFKWSSLKYDIACPKGVNGWAPGGHVEIVQDNKSGGTGTEIHFNNASLGIIAPTATTVKDVMLKFGDHGGTVNLILKGAMLNAKDFKSITAPPGVNLVVSPGLPLGTLKLSGKISQFYFSFPCPAYFPVQKYTAVVGGGQELWIDDIEFTLSK